MSNDLTAPGTTAVVTGCAGGVGTALAEALTERGVHVVSFDLQEAPAATESVIVDVRVPEAVGRAAIQVLERRGPPHTVVCAAGLVAESPLEELTVGDFNQVVEVSLLGTYAVCRALVPAMADAGRGAVVAVSTGYATTGYALGGHYAAAKAGVEALVKSLAREFAPAVRANVVAPGPVETPMLEHIEDRASWQRQREAAIPMGRIGRPIDVVGPMLFLLGPGSGYVTGQVLHVNGGLLMP